MRGLDRRVDRPGRTGLRLVLGTAQLGQSYGIANSAGRPDQGTVRAIVNAAREHGIDFLDTARAYGGSEADLGAAAPHGRPYVVTKIAPLKGTDNVDAVRRSWEASTVALGSKAIDITDLLLHRALDAERPGVWDALRRIRDSAGLRRIGVSVQSTGELLDVLDKPDLGHVQFPYNVLDRRWLAPEIVDALAARPEVIVIARSVYLQGLLITCADWPSGHCSTAFTTPLDRLAASTGSGSRAALCVRFALAHPTIDAVVIGAETPQQVVENAGLAARSALSDDAVAAVLDNVPAGPPDLIDPSRWRR